ncbi:hypothetical protein [Carboxylicivirga taeanensis]|uniref:hypothetical protein n=1 Tax=Carboxylicivirga taeanensis TaxID=1416875 RepID=UPI003F6E3D70
MIHVVSLTIPSPPNYGGVIDIYYKLKALYELNIDIHLHCFQYNKERAPELEKICSKVSYYKRPIRLIDHLSLKPFIVKSRTSKRLIDKLNEDNSKIIVEGIHGLGILNKVDHNRIFVRTHNIEQQYYKELRKACREPLKKVFYAIEHLKLKLFEQNLKQVEGIMSISSNDCDFFSQIQKSTFLVPAFHEHSDISSKSGKGSYILIHGNLAVDENIKSVLFLINNVLCKTTQPVILAGLNPHKSISKACAKFPHIELIASPSEKKMKSLIRQSQMILLHTFQATGIKLKLINSLYTGRHIICNDLMVKYSNLEELVNIASTPNDWISLINQLMDKDVSEVELKKRKMLLDKYYNNQENAKRIAKLLYI